MKKEIRGFFLLFLILSTSIIAYSKILDYQNEYNGNVIKSIEQYPIPSSTEYVPFKVGFASNPAALDPVDTWDDPSQNVQHQVIEGLVEYDYSTHPYYTIKPVLAESWVWDSDTQITFTLRQGVQFHDGTMVTAEDIKWNFERVQYFINATGVLPANSTSWKAFPSSLFFHSDGTPIFDSFIADDNIDPYEFTIILSKPFGALLDLLCFGATDILSPESTPRYRYLDLATDDLVGTGPFDYQHFWRDWEVKFKVFENYWRGEAQIKEMIWTIIEDDVARMTAGLSGQFDYIDQVVKTYIDTFKADSDFHVEDVGEDLCYFYLEIYCGPRDTAGNMLNPGNPQYQKNPAYLRRALALAINYTYIYEEIQSGYAVEGTTAVPRAMPGHNASVIQASDDSFTYKDNLVKARQLLKDNAADIVLRGGIDCSGWDVNNDLDWLGKDLIGRPLEINRHFGSITNLIINLLMADNFDMIGIQTHEKIRDWAIYLDTGENTPWEIDIAYSRWYPDYLNPFNMIDPLFNLDSGSCFSRINDTSTGGLTELMDAAAIETDYSTQLDYYMKIQSLIYDINRPLNPASHTHISGWVYLVQQVHKAELENFSYNVMEILDLYSLNYSIHTSTEYIPFKVGYWSNPAALDPVDTWDVPSRNVQHQVIEGLVEYDYSTHPNYTIKPMLAESWVWDSNTQITFTLRQGVQFHDGTMMTAEDVKWNFERVQYFINATGVLPANSTSWTAFPSTLFFYSDGTPIFDSFIADDNIDPYEFTIILSKPFGALLDLLCFGATDILSPESTPRYRYLKLATDDLVGTGPFDYQHFFRDWEVKFKVFENYWRGEAQIKEMIWTIIEDDSARMTAALSGQFDYVSQVIKTYIDTFRADTDFHVEDVGEDLCYFYLEIYCGPRDTAGTMMDPGNPQYQKNPPYLRRALALALNYSYIYNEIQSGYAVEGTTAVPRAMPGHNASIVQASDSSFAWSANIVKARQLLKDNAADIVLRGGIDCSGWDVNNVLDWLGKDLLGRHLEINRHFGSNTNLNLNLLMNDNFDMLGIQTHETIREWGVYLDTGENTPWKMDIGYVGWCPDYLNPFNIIDPLFNLDSPSCFSRINDTSTGGLTELMDAAAIETDYPTQLDYYMKIQSLIYDVNRPLNPASHAHISGWVYLVQQVHKAELENFSYNVMGILDLYSIEWAPGNFYLNSDADTPDLDGNFNLTWTISQGADNYSVFTSNSYITDIDGSLTLLAFQNATSPYSIIGLSNGTYYYIVAAYNEYGYTLSNCINVTIKKEPPKLFTLSSSAEEPDPDGDFNLIWTISVGADNYSVFTSSSDITELDGNQTLLSQNATSPYVITGLSNGTYYYIVAAYNEYGYRLSNCISVTIIKVAPEPFTLSSNAEFPDPDGDFNLIWTISVGADNYSVFTSNSYITDIDGSVTLLAFQNATSPYSIIGLSTDVYYYIVAAYNEYGYRLSNCISVTIIKVAPEPFTLSSNAEDPDLDGDFNLIWTISQYADNYSVFTSNSYIMDIDGSVTLLAFQNATSPYSIIGLSTDVYYYVVVAYNEYGYTLSNCIIVTVRTEPPEPFTLSSSAEDPDLDGDFNLIWTISQYADNYSVFTSNSYIMDIDGSVTLLAFQNATSPYSIIGLSTDVYYYVVVAYNEYGFTLSNCVSIVVIIEEINGDGTIPGYNIFLVMAILGLVSSILVFRQLIKKNYRDQ